MAKITKAEMPALAEQIVKCLGGKENVARINHCATRLRVNPVDMEKVDKDGLKRLHGVIGIDSSKAELQIIVGAIIEDLYLEVEKITGNGGGAVADDVPFWKKRPSEIFSSFLLLMAGCLSPVIPALIASGLLATVLTIMTLVLHVDASTSSTYSILYNLSQTVFYFHAGPSGLHLCQEVRHRAGSGHGSGLLPAVPGLGGWCGRLLHPLLRPAGPAYHL